jgi:hypothetical protein
MKEKDDYEFLEKKGSFHEHTYITPIMKKCFEQFKRMYPRAKTYNDILLSILLEFQQMFINPHTKKFDSNDIRSYSKQRLDLHGQKLPVDIDWTIPLVRLYSKFEDGSSKPRPVVSGKSRLSDTDL